MCILKRFSKFASVFLRKLKVKMIIDESGHIEVESEKDYKTGKINDYAITSDPNQVLYTKDLLTCVGVAIVEKLPDGNLKRGLGHIFYSPDVLSRYAEQREDHVMVPTKEEIRLVENDLEKFVSNFRDPRIVLVFNSFKKNKMEKLRNPMANYLFYHLTKMGGMFPILDNLTDKTLAGNYENEIEAGFHWGDDLKTFSKDVGLHKDKLVVIHRAPSKSGQPGRWLNQDEKGIPLDFNW